MTRTLSLTVASTPTHLAKSKRKPNAALTANTVSIPMTVSEHVDTLSKIEEIQI